MVGVPLALGSTGCVSASLACSRESMSQAGADGPEPLRASMEMVGVARRSMALAIVTGILSYRRRRSLEKKKMGASRERKGGARFPIKGRLRKTRAAPVGRPCRIVSWFKMKRPICTRAAIYTYIYIHTNIMVRARKIVNDLSHNYVMGICN